MVKVTVRFFGTEIADRPYPAEELLEVVPELRFGTPVAYQSGKQWWAGQVVCSGAEKSWVTRHFERTWGSNFGEIANSSIKPVVTRVFAVGESVSALEKGIFRDAVIERVDNGGVSYIVKFGNRVSRFPLNFTEVTEALH